MRAVVPRGCARVCARARARVRAWSLVRERTSARLCILPSAHPYARSWMHTCALVRAHVHACLHARVCVCVLPQVGVGLAALCRWTRGQLGALHLDGNAAHCSCALIRILPQAE
eukprot:15442878-Alexandrium_andersonii.AAC.1